MLRVAGVVAMLAALLPFGPPRAASAAVVKPSFVSLLFGRAQWAPSEGCQTLPGGLTLAEIGARLGAEGRVASGAVVTDRIDDTTRTCVEGHLNPTWSDLAALQSSGWEMVSGGRKHAARLSTRTLAAQQNEICGSLEILRAHGHLRAWGLFASKGLQNNETIQRDVVSQCFSYGRTYGTRQNVKNRMTEPWFQKTWSLEGGRCNQPEMPCASVPVDRNNLYQSPAAVSAYVQVSGDRWAALQAYRLVEGTRSIGNVQWDCTGADWTSHWTTQVELYCWDDYLSIVRSVPATATVTDPATVAESWGRPGSLLPIPS